MGRSLPRWLVAVTWLPEFNVLVFAILLNYPWEFLQVPMFDRMPDAPHWEAIKTCTRATLGDGAIMLAAYWCVAAVARSRRWIVDASTTNVLLFAAVGTSTTIIIERLALNGMWLDGWAYSPWMPIVPVVEVGLTPILQWIVLPPLVVWFARRQLTSLRT